MNKLILTVALSSVASIAYAGSGIASWYGPGFHGKRTASGQVYNQHALTTACHRGLKLGTQLKVTNIKNGKSVVVVCNDRGAFDKKYGRVLDLSKGAFSRIASTSQGVIRVNYEVIK